MADGSFHAHSQSTQLYSVIWIGKKAFLIPWVQLTRRCFSFISIGKTSGMETGDKATSLLQVRQIGCVYTSKFKCACAVKHDGITKWLDCVLAWVWPVSICNFPPGLESGGVYPHKGRLLHASWLQNPGTFNLPVETHPLGPCAVWDWTQVGKSFCSDLCLSPPGATLCWVKTIQDFTLVAFCFNPFCDIHRDVIPTTKLIMRTSLLKLMHLHDDKQNLVEGFRLQRTSLLPFLRAGSANDQKDFSEDVCSCFTLKTKSLGKCYYKTLCAPLEWGSRKKSGIARRLLLRVKTQWIDAICRSLR